MDTIEKTLSFQNVDGVRVPQGFSPRLVREALAYKPIPDDTFIITFSKCGTTWMQNVVLYIFRKGKALEQPSDFRKCSPFIDISGTEVIANMPRPGAIKTHFPFSHVNYSRDAKYIYVARNPKDCCVSLYHHMKLYKNYYYWDGQFDELFEYFLEDEVEYNGYFNHLLSWYPRLKDPNVFFTTYEEMKRDLKGVVVRVARFLGKEYIEAIQNDNDVLNNILHLCSFQAMKENLSSEFDSRSLVNKSKVQDLAIAEGLKYSLNSPKPLNVSENRPTGNFFRKGVVGDWKTHFTFDQSERLDKIFQEKTKGTDILNWFVTE